MKTILVLGTGCPKCKKLMEITQQVVSDTGVEAEIRKVEEITEILKYNVMSTPALVIDGVVKVAGRIPKQEELKNLLGI